jgi:hypothetical protein
MSVMRRVLIVTLAFFVVFLSIFVLAGTGLVLGPVKRMIERAVEENLGIPLSIGSLRGHLFFSLQAEDIRSPGLGKIDGIRLTYNPVPLLSRHIDIRSVRIEGVDVDIDGLTSMLRNLPKRPRQEGAKSTPLRIEIGAFSIIGGGLSMMLGETRISASLDARGSMMSDRLMIDSLHLSTSRSMAVVRGVVPFTQSIELDLTYNIAFGIEDVGLREMKGTLYTGGTFTGLYSSPLIVAETRVDAWLLESHITGLVKSNWRLPSFDSISIEGGLRVVTASLEGEAGRNDSLEVKIVLWRTNLSAEVGSRYGRLLADGVLKGNFARPYFEGSIDGGFEHAGFNPSVRGSVSFVNDVLRVSDMKIVSRRVSAELDLLVDLKKKVISEAGLALSSNDLSVVNSFVSGPEDISGNLLFELNVDGSFDDPRGEAHLMLSDVRLYGEEIKVADFDFSVVNGGISLQQGTLATGRGELNITGSYDWKKKGFAAHLQGDPIAIRSPEVFGTDTLLINGEIALDMMFSGEVENPQGTGRIYFRNMAYDTVDFGDYHLDFGLVDTVMTISLVNETGNSTILGRVFLLEPYPYDATLKLDHFELDTFLQPATGFVTGEVSASGELAHADGTVATARIDTVFLQHDQKPVQNLAPVIVHLEDRMISMRPAELSVAGQKLLLHGSMPLDLRSGRFDLWARSSMIELSSIAHLFPTDPPVEGILEFDIHFQGMPRAIDIDGRLSVHNARFETKHVLIDSVDCVLGLKNGVVTVESCRGRINKGWFDIRGFANLSTGQLDTIMLAADLNKAAYADKSFGRVVLSAKMRLSGKKDSLRIDGEVVVNEGIYDAPMRLQTVIGMLTTANRPVPEQSEMLKRIYCDVGISVPDSVQIANNVANLTAKADLEVKGYLARPNAYGTIMAIGEGSVQYLGKKFTIVNAIVQFDDPYKIDPVIDLAATTSVTAADGDYDIFLLLNGTVTTWQLQLSSNPPLPEQDIVSLLLIGQRRPGEVTGMSRDVDLKGKAKDYALDAIRHGLEKTTQDFLGLDKFTLSGDLSDPSTVRIGVEKSIVKGFRLIYSTGVESWELHQIGASYDLTHHLSVFTLHDQENLNTSVDLDFHLEIR